MFQFKKFHLSIESIKRIIFFVKIIFNIDYWQFTIVIELNIYHILLKI